MQKSASPREAVVKFQHRRQPEAPGVPTKTTFLFPSAPPAPSEYAFVDGEGPFPVGRMTRSGPSAPPPYAFGRISSHVYDMIDPKSGHEWMFRVALVEFLFGVLAASCAVSCAVQINRYCPYYTGDWVATIFLINAVLGVIAAKKATVNFFVAHLVTSVLAVVGSIILLALSIHNWNEAGYTTGDLCVLTRHDTAYWNKKIWFNAGYGYAQCVYDFKLGITFNVILMICAVLEGTLSFASTIFCLKTMCHCTKWGYRR